MTFGLLVALPLLCIAGWVAQRPMPTLARLPRYEWPAETRDASATVDGNDEPGTLLSARWIEGNPPQVEARLLVDPDLPDLLVYWSDRAPAEEAQGAQDSDLPADSVLLGSIHGTRPVRYPMPGSGRCRLVLFSLGHQECVGSLELSPDPAGPDGASSSR